MLSLIKIIFLQYFYLISFSLSSAILCFSDSIPITRVVLPLFKRIIKHAAYEGTVEDSVCKESLSTFYFSRVSFNVF